MAAGPKRMRGKVAMGIGLIALTVGAYATWNWTAFRAGWAVQELRTATTDEARASAAAKLVSLGQASLPQLLELFREDDSAACFAVAAALRESVQTSSPTDPAFAPLHRQLLLEAASFSDAGQDAALDLAVDLNRSTQAEALAAVREGVRAATKAKAPETAVRAVRSLSEVNLKAEAVAFLRDNRAEVRRAAMNVVGPAVPGSETAIGDEELFAWLNDPDIGVQAVCEAALATRGLDVDQVAAARKLAHPEPAERLKLLLDLRRGRDGVLDPGPWLERLSRDPEPAVRAGAARVAVECGLSFVGWLDRLATEDSDGTVREIARHFRMQQNGLRQAGFDDR